MVNDNRFLRSRGRIRLVSLSRLILQEKLYSVVQTPGSFIKRDPPGEAHPCVPVVSTAHPPLFPEGHAPTTFQSL